MHFIPREISIHGIYLPPYMLAGILGVSLAALTALLLNRYRLSRFFFYPPLIFLALAIIYGGLISIFVVPA
jgi:hypothetical protein